MKVKLVSKTDRAEEIMAYCARVSSPHQDSQEYSRLLSYCIRNQHWSVFEMADLTLEITTSRAISAQILRHRSFHFQEFSQRYAKVTTIEPFSLRRQDPKNRQNSTDDLDAAIQNGLESAILEYLKLGQELYDEMLNNDIAKESARMVLPMATQTKLYMKGTVRDWIHYITLRSGEGTQAEHRDVAKEAKEIFIQEFPIVSEALGWINAIRSTETLRSDVVLPSGQNGVGAPCS